MNTAPELPAAPASRPIDHSISGAQLFLRSISARRPAGRCSPAARRSKAAASRSVPAVTTAAECAICAFGAGSRAWRRTSPVYQHIYFEEVRRHAGTDAAHIYGGLLATLTAWCEQHGIAYQGVPVGTIKRFIAGKGNADKAGRHCRRARPRLPPADDNEADAIAILLWSIETQGGVR